MMGEKVGSPQSIKCNEEQEGRGREGTEGRGSNKYKGPETGECVALSRHCKHIRVLCMGEELSKRACPKEVTPKLRLEGQDGVIEDSIPARRKSTREVLKAREQNESRHGQ